MKSILSLLFLIAFSIITTAQLKQDFTDDFVGRTNNLKGYELIPYKDGYVSVHFKPMKDDPNTLRLETLARKYSKKKGSSGEYIGGFVYNLKKINKNVKEIYDYYPQQFLKLKGGNYMVCGKGYVIEIDENLKFKSWSSKPNYSFKTLSEGKSGEVLACYVNEKGEAGSLIYNINTNKIYTKQINFKPKYGMIKNFVLNDSMYIEVYGFVQNNKNVGAIALKNYRTIETNNKQKNFRYEQVFANYNYLSYVQKYSDDKIIGIGVSSGSTDSYEVFVYDILQKKVIYTQKITEHLKGKNIESSYLRLCKKGDQFLLVGPAKYYKSDALSKDEYKWMKTFDKIPFAMVLNRKLEIQKEGFLVDPSQGELASKFRNSNIYLYDESTNQVMIKCYNRYDEEESIVHAKLNF